MATCEGNSDECSGEATTMRDYSDGWLPAERLCEACAAVLDKRAEDGPGDDQLLDGEAFRGDEAAAHQRHLSAEAWRLK